MKPTPTVTPLLWNVPPMTSCAVWRTEVDDVWVREVVMEAVAKVRGISAIAMCYVMLLIAIIKFG